MLVVSLSPCWGFERFLKVAKALLPLCHLPSPWTAPNCSDHQDPFCYSGQREGTRRLTQSHITGGGGGGCGVGWGASPPPPTPPPRPPPRTGDVACAPTHPHPPAQGWASRASSPRSCPDFPAENPHRGRLNRAANT